MKKLSRAVENKRNLQDAFVSKYAGKLSRSAADKCLGEVFPRDVDGLKVGCGQGSPMGELRV